MKKIIAQLVALLQVSALSAQDRLAAEPGKTSAASRFSPWIWIIGAALIIVALVISSKKRSSGQ